MTHPTEPTGTHHAPEGPATQNRMDRTMFAIARPACPLLFADTETTGLTRPHLTGGRRIWEAAVIRRDPSGFENYFHAYVSVADIGLTTFMPPEALYDNTAPLRDRLYASIPDDIRKGLDIGGFFDRHPEMTNGIGVHPNVYSERDLAAQLAQWMSAVPGGVKPHLIGAVPSFDDDSFADLLLRHGFITGETPWHYHLIDVETAAAAKLGALPPWDSRDLSIRLGLNPDSYAAHTALGDARWARDIFDVVFAPPFATGGIVQ